MPPGQRHQGELGSARRIGINSKILAEIFELDLGVLTWGYRSNQRAVVAISRHELHPFV